MRHILLAAVILALPTTLTPAAAVSVTASRTLLITAPDADQAVPVSAGDLLRIELSVSAGTGYHWEKRPVDARYLVLVEEQVVPLPPRTRPAGGPPMVGGPTGTARWVYYVRAPLPAGAKVSLGFVAVPPSRAQDASAVNDPTLNVMRFPLAPR